MFTEHPIQWNETTVARLWNWYSRTSPFRDLYFAKRFGDLILRRSGLAPSAPLRILDFGCGPGFLWDHFKHVGVRWHYVGADFSADSIAQLESKARGAHGFAGAYRVERLPLPLPTASFDAAFLVEVVEHLDDAQLAPILGEMHRLLKPGGRLVISTPNSEDLSQSMRLCPECGAIFHEWQHVRSWEAESLSEYMRRFGFRPVRVRPEDFFARGAHRMAFNALRRALRGTSKPHLLGIFAR
ncbi:MAG: methyltransferase domain-containing protein [Casimicrobiaceae bacterium]|nr:methyltransferase domain-containing protein [Casimicrobiaceae bacterium]